jgi:C4-dicarboxylate transporter DctM subunit
MATSSKFSRAGIAAVALTGLDATVAGISRVCEILLVLVLLAMTIVTGAGVVSRYIQGSPLAWTDEVAGYLFVILTFLGAACGVARGEHPRVTILVDRLPEIPRRGADAVAFGTLLGLLAVLVEYGYSATVQAEDVSMTSLAVSQGWAYAIVPLASALMVLFALRNFFAGGAGLIEVAIAAATLVLLWWLGTMELDGAAVYVCLVLALIATLLLGIPVGFALSVTALLVLNATGLPLDVVPQRLFDGTSSVILLAIPLFMLTGTVMSAGGMAERLAAFATCLFGRIQGGLGIADVAASVVFADISGSAVADSAAIGSIMIPQMRKRGYSLEFASALQAAAGSLGLMFPPSSTMIVYAWVTNISLTALFLHSFVPGLLVAVSFSLVVYFFARARGYPRESGITPAFFLRTTRTSFLALLTPVIILVAILGGFTTPGEAGVVAAVYALLVSVGVYRNLAPKKLFSVFLEAALSASRVTLIIAAATLLSWVITTFQGPQKISAMLIGVTTNPIIMLILLNVLMTVLHTMLEGISTILVLVPAILPMMRALHIDPIIFGIILAQNSALGLLFPPLGFNLYVISSISGIAVERVAVAVIPFVAILAVDILLLILFPQIATALPRLVSIL